MKSRVIFASLVLGLGLMTSQADAATTTNTDDSPAASKSTSVMLVNGSEKQFASYVERYVKGSGRSTNWQNFMSVVTLFNQNPTAVLTFSPADRAQFNEAAAQVNTQLAKRKNAEANRWVDQAGHTARMINFLWDTDQSNSEPADIQ